ncbi:MAG: SpoIIE family protein phosphatase [Methanoregula sp.]|nr:SpoIIE family protein phosphatase [Methanoregula sp.]
MFKPPFLSFKRLSIRYYLIFVIVCIILLVIGFLITAAYMQAKQDTITQDAYLQQYTELNTKESVYLVNQGLDLFDSTLNDKMAAAFKEYLDEYAKSGGDLSKIDYMGLKNTLGKNFDGELDVYVINESGVVIRSTVPEVLGLDLSKYADYSHALPKMLAGDSFAADRVVRSVADANATTVTGKLRKFAFMPTPDHRYLLELGLASSSFENERADLSYFDTSKKLEAINPNLKSIRVFDVHKNLFTKGGVYRSPSPDPEQERILDTVLATRSDYVTVSPDLHTSKKYLFVNLSGSDSASDMSVVAELTYSDENLVKKLNDLLVYHLSLGFIAVVLGILAAYGAARLITRPINEIVEDVDIISRGKLDHTIRSMMNVEFTRLEQSINLMIRRIKEESEELERKNAELQIAAQIQESFLPAIIEPVPGYDIAAMSIPAKVVGGDFYDIIPGARMRDKKEHVGIIIADVSGKGLSAAIFMALSIVIIRVNAAWHEMPEDIFRDANTIITAEQKANMFVTAFFGVLNRALQTFTYVNAGHNSPMVLHAYDDHIIELEPTGIALGLMEDSLYKKATIPLTSGDLIVLFTDGVTEATNIREELYGEERLQRIILANRRLSAGEITKKILLDVQEFTGEAPQSDDITLLVVKVN